MDYYVGDDVARVGQSFWINIEFQLIINSIEFGLIFTCISELLTWKTVKLDVWIVSAWWFQSGQSETITVN